jgi:hypothetical protein
VGFKESDDLVGLCVSVEATDNINDDGVHQRGSCFRQSLLDQVEILFERRVYQRYYVGVNVKYEHL